MKTFVDIVALFPVEYCLLFDLNAVFSPLSVLQLDRQLVYETTSKSQLDHLLREQTQKRFIVLQTGLDICNTYLEQKLSSN